MNKGGERNRTVFDSLQPKLTRESSTPSGVRTVGSCATASKRRWLVFYRISVAKLKFIGINKRIKAAGDEPLPYKFRIKFFVFYTAKPKFKRSG